MAALTHPNHSSTNDTAYHRVRSALAARGPIRETATALTARCPAHDDRAPSLSVTEADDGRVLVYCHAGCETETIVAALGLTMADLFDRPMLRPLPARRRETARTVYEIRDLNGATVAEHVRLEHDDGSKSLFWRRDGENGLSGYRLAELPLYRTETLIEAPTGSTVVLTEGEKAADALAARGLRSVGTVTGAASAPSADRLDVLRGFDVVLWPDHDDVGRDHMRRIAATLATLGIRARWLDWPEAPDHGDAADFTGSSDELHGLLDLAPVCDTTGDDREVAMLRREVAALRADLDAERAAHAETRAALKVRDDEIRMQREIAAAEQAVLANPNATKPVLLAGLHLVREVASAEARGENLSEKPRRLWVGTRPPNCFQDDEKPTRDAPLAETIGCSPSRASAAVQVLADAKLIEKTTEDVPTRGRGRPVTRTYWRPLVSASEMVARLVDLDQSAIERDDGTHRGRWGGAHNKRRCSDHPTAPVRLTTHYECSVCGTVVADPETHPQTVNAAIFFQDEENSDVGATGINAENERIEVRTYTCRNREKIDSPRYVPIETPDGDILYATSPPPEPPPGPLFADGGAA